MGNYLVAPSLTSISCSYFRIILVVTSLFVYYKNIYVIPSGLD